MTTPVQAWRETGSLAGMRFGAYFRVSRAATKTEFEVARRGGRDFDKSIPLSCLSLRVYRAHSCSLGAQAW